MKKFVKDISLILIMSLVAAFVYNFYSSKPLPLIRQQEIITEIPDSLLFTNNAEYLNKSIEKIDSNSNKNEIKIDSSKIKKDTLKIKDTKLAKDSTNNKKNITITFSQMKKIINNPNFVIIDARNSETYALAHIGNAINIHPYWEPNEYFPKITSLPKDKTIVIYCDGGNCELSHKVEADLKSFGYEKVFIYVGGWEDWKKNGGN